MANEEQYPKDFQEFLGQFKTEDDCWNLTSWAEIVESTDRNVTRTNKVLFKFNLFFHN